MAPAERLPFEDATFDLLTVGLAFHWFDQAAFLTEASRVLRLGGWLVVYSSAFSDRMIEDASFSEWNRGIYLERFPSPPRGAAADVAGQSMAYGFGNGRNETFAHDEEMTADQFVAYLLTQTNIIARVDGGDEALEAVATWLCEQVRPYFSAGTRTLHFVGRVVAVERLGM